MLNVQSPAGPAGLPRPQAGLAGPQGGPPPGAGGTPGPVGVMGPGPQAPQQPNAVPTGGVSQDEIMTEFGRRQQNMQKLFANPETPVPDKLDLISKLMKSMPDEDPDMMNNPLSKLVAGGKKAESPGVPYPPKSEPFGEGFADRAIGGGVGGGLGASAGHLFQLLMQKLKSSPGGRKLDMLAALPASTAGGLMGGVAGTSLGGSGILNTAKTVGDHGLGLATGAMAGIGTGYAAGGLADIVAKKLKRSPMNPLARAGVMAASNLAGSGYGGYQGISGMLGYGGDSAKTSSFTSTDRVKLILLAGSKQTKKASNPRVVRAAASQTITAWCLQNKLASRKEASWMGTIGRGLGSLALGAVGAGVGAYGANKAIQGQGSEGFRLPRIDWSGGKTPATPAKPADGGFDFMQYNPNWTPEEMDSARQKAQSYYNWQKEMMGLQQSLYPQPQPFYMPQAGGRTQPTGVLPSAYGLSGLNYGNPINYNAPGK